MKKEDDYVFCSKCETNPCKCKNWEKEYYKKFTHGGITGVVQLTTDNAFEIKAFIKKVEKQAFIDGVKAQTKILNRHYKKVIKKEREDAINGILNKTDEYLEIRKKK